LSLTPLELIDRLTALIPPPRLHRHRYHGVLAPHAPLPGRHRLWARCGPRPDSPTAGGGCAATFTARCRGTQ
jgi:hypothetical protein